MLLSDAAEQFAQGYFSTCRRAAKTVAAYKVDLKQLLSALGRQAALESIEPEAIERWAMTMRSAGYAVVSVRRKMATARVFFMYWVRRKQISASPFWRIRLDLGRTRVLPRSLSAADAKAIIEEAWREYRLGGKDGDFRLVRNLAAVEILFATAMRVGELVKLDLNDWREDETTFVVKGKGDRERLAILPDDRSRSAVCMYVSQRNAIHQSEPSLFLNPAGKRLSSQGVARILSQMAERAGLKTAVTPHMIRHTVATLLLRYGADIRVVQEVLGHSSIATTQRYTHVSKEHLVSTLAARHPNHHLQVDVAARKGPSSDMVSALSLAISGQ